MKKENNKVNVESKGANLFLVDPNPSGRNVVSPEDMFIYVKLTATERSRSVTTIGENDNTVESSNVGVIDFIATDVKYDSAGIPQKNIMGDEISYATTNYTSIGGIQNSFGSGLLEGFGITSINIKYNTSLVPTVDIEFVDLRGSGLFDVIEQDNRKSPYSIFFKMPYPIFNLTVKGYFGKPVSYCLNMINWTSKFDPSTGNFNISANFVGFQQAFLNDLTLGDIVGTVNTPIGAANLKKLKFGPNKNIDTPTIDEFVKKISELQRDLEALKIEEDTFKDLIILNTQLKKLEVISTFIGKPIPKDNSDTVGSDTQIRYSKQPNNPDKIQSTPINSSNLVLNENYNSIRDLLFFKNSVNLGVDNYMQDLYNKLQDYKKFYLENKTKLGNNDKIVKDGSLTDLFPFDENNNGLSVGYDKFKLSFDNTGKNYIINLVNYIDILSSTDKLKGNFTSKDFPVSNNINSEFKPSDIKITKFSRTDDGSVKGNKSTQFTNTDIGFVLDFRGIRMWITDMILEIKKSKKQQEEKTIKQLNDKLSKSLGYQPTIGNVFEIFCNNAQAFLSTVYEVSKKAESKSVLKDRQKALNSLQPKTDIPLKRKNDFKSATIFAFPAIYLEKDGGYEEKYLGSEDVFGKDKEVQTTFPEIKFIEDVVLAITKNESKLKSFTDQTIEASKSDSGRDTDDWIPLNPLDYSVNPFFLLSSTFRTSGEKVLKEKFIKSLVQRYLVLKNYSNYSDTQSYGGWDGILADLSFSEPTIKDMLHTFLNPEGVFNVKGELKNNKWEIKVQSGSQNINFKFDKEFEFNKVNVGTIGLSGGTYLVLGDSSLGKKLLTNDVKAPKKIEGLTDFKNKFIKDDGVVRKDNMNYQSWSNNNYNLYSNQSYACWLNGEVLASKSGNVKNNFNIKDNDLTLIDGGSKPDSPINANTEYINIFSKQSNPPVISSAPIPPTIGSTDVNETVAPPPSSPNPTDINESIDSSEIQIPRFLTDTLFYQNQNTNNERALLLLSTFPFTVWGNISVPSITSVINLPKHFLLFIGGNLWRNSLSSDPIEWINESTDSPNIPTTEQYVNWPWESVNKRGSIEEEIKKLPSDTKKVFINYFLSWVSKDFSSFENKIIKYCESENINDKYVLGNRISSELNKTTELIVLTPSVFTNKGSETKMTFSGFDTYLNQFKLYFNNTLDESNSDEEEVEDNKTRNLEDIKHSAHNSIKNVYERWIAGSTNGKIAFNACSSKSEKPLFDYFNFIDRGFNDIGNKAIINLESVLKLSDNLQTSLYIFMSTLLKDSNFLFQIMPNYINYKDPDEVSDMFKPIVNVTDRNDNTGPTYLCIYAGGSSQVLDIDEKSRYTFKNDGFSFDLPPTDIMSKKSDKDGNPVNLVAFRVAFGAENQTLFKSVSLNQQEHKDTSEYYATLTDLIDKRGGTSRSYQGTDLFKMFRSRSYTCNVESLGCMNIQPMMYFQLDNVPFFEGAYMILNVTHNISPNHMTTSFTGVRQSKYLNPVVDKMTTFLDINLDEKLDTEPVIEVSLTDGDFLELTNNGIDLDGNLPEEPFDMEELNEGTLVDIGVNNSNVSEIASSLKSKLSSAGIITNSELTMFTANAMSFSNDFNNTVEEWGSEDNKTFLFENNNPFGNSDKEEAKKYRRRGFIPICGKDQYERFAQDYGYDINVLSSYDEEVPVDVAMDMSIWRWQNNPYNKSYQNKQKITENESKLVEINAELQTEGLVSFERAFELTDEKQKIEKELEDLLSQEDPNLKSEKNYPPSVWSDGGSCNNFNQTVENLSFKDGKNTIISFDKFNKILNVCSTSGKEGDRKKLVGVNKIGKPANLDKGTTYKPDIAQNLIQDTNPTPTPVNNNLTTGGGLA